MTNPIRQFLFDTLEKGRITSQDMKVCIEKIALGKRYAQIQRTKKLMKEFKQNLR